MTKEEFQTKLEKLKTEIAQVKLNIKAGQEKNTNAHKKLKKEIAQLLTTAKAGFTEKAKTKSK